MKYTLILLILLCSIAAQEGYAQAGISQCDHLLHEGIAYSGGDSFQKGYDTLRLFIESCAADIHHPSYTWISVFGNLGGDYSGAGIPASSYREWLKSVLYLNHDSDYYCANVGEMFSTFVNEANDPTGETDAQLMATIKYLVESKRCPDWSHEYTEIYGGAAAMRHRLWLDTVMMENIDTVLHPYDSTLPALEDFGMGILRGPTQSVRPATDPHTASLLSISVLNNPFSSSLDLSLEMGRQALVTVEMFDVLGNSVPLQGMKYRLKDAGSPRITVPTGDLSSGTYYLRVSTDWGDVKTVKVVKQ